MSPEVVGVLGFVGLLVLLALRIPVAIAMIAVAMAGTAVVLDPSVALVRLGQDGFREAVTFSLSVIPMFILMGLLLASARLGEDLYKAFDRFLWRVRGGLGVATVGAAGLFGAVSGSAVASATTMSVVAVPEMRRFNYDPGYAAATAAVGGTLGAVIPPSAVLVFFGVLTEESIGRLLIGGIVPGAMTTGMLMITAYLVARWKPSVAPRRSQRPDLSVAHAIGSAWPVPVIFGFSMGGLYLGVFTPTEAGAAGAFLALLYGLVTRRLTWSTFRLAVSRTIRTSALIFFLVIAGKMFAFFLAITRVPRQLGDWVVGLDVTPVLIITAIFVIYFVLGALMDEIGILVIFTPITYPVVIELGYSGVWFGVLSIMMGLTGLLTPPVGLMTFVVSGVTKIPLGQVFRGVTPFVVTLSIAIMLVIVFPELVTFLPDLMR